MSEQKVTNRQEFVFEEKVLMGEIKKKGKNWMAPDINVIQNFLWRTHKALKQAC